jgi:hypothetical protein
MKFSKQSQCKADHAPPSCAKFKNKGNNSYAHDEVLSLLSTECLMTEQTFTNPVMYHSHLKSYLA